MPLHQAACTGDPTRYPPTTMPSFCAVPIPKLIYAGPSSKEEFDRINLPEMVHDWAHCKTTTLIKNDGQQWERRCHSKTLGEYTDPVTVVFQWFDERVAEAPAPASS